MWILSPKLNTLSITYGIHLNCGIIKHLFAYSILSKWSPIYRVFMSQSTTWLSVQLQSWVGPPTSSPKSPQAILVRREHNAKLCAWALVSDISLWSLRDSLCLNNIMPDFHQFLPDLVTVLTFSGDLKYPRNLRLRVTRTCLSILLQQIWLRCVYFPQL